MLLNKFQHMSDWFQDWFGVNNFFITKILGIIIILFLEMQFAFSFLSKEKDIPSGIISILLFMLMIGYLWISFQNEEENCNQNWGFINSAVIYLSPLRLIIAFFTPFVFMILPKEIANFLNETSKNQEQEYHILAGICLSIKDLTLFFYIYLGCCTPKPYKTSRVKKLINQIKERVVVIGSKITNPIPVS